MRNNFLGKKLNIYSGQCHTLSDETILLHHIGQLTSDLSVFSLISQVYGAHVWQAGGRGNLSLEFVCLAEWVSFIGLIYSQYQYTSG